MVIEQIPRIMFSDFSYLTRYVMRIPLFVWPDTQPCVRILDRSFGVYNETIIDYATKITHIRWQNQYVRLQIEEGVFFPQFRIEVYSRRIGRIKATLRQYVIGYANESIRCWQVTKKEKQTNNIYILKNTLCTQIYHISP